MCVHCWRRLEDGVRYPEVGVRVSCEAPVLGAGNWTQVLWKSSECSSLLSCLSSSTMPFLVCRSCLFHFTSFLLSPCQTLFVLGTKLYNIFTSAVLLFVGLFTFMFRVFGKVLFSKFSYLTYLLLAQDDVELIVFLQLPPDFWNSKYVVPHLRFFVVVVVAGFLKI